MPMFVPMIGPMFVAVLCVVVLVVFVVFVVFRLLAPVVPSLLFAEFPSKLPSRHFRDE